MDKIYSSAKPVVVWLGVADEHSRIAKNTAAGLDTTKYIKEFVSYKLESEPLGS
jgi:hypothetical protein